MIIEDLRHSIRNASHADEHSVIAALCTRQTLTGKQRSTVLATARELVQDCRQDKQGKDTLDAFLLEFGLSNNEGIALMCLAEALLRVPDAHTADRLIAEKIQTGDWGSHRGNSESLFVNASTWGLMLTGKITQLDSAITGQPGHWIKQLTGKLGEPIVRTAVLQAMKIMGGQYVLGRSIEEGMSRGAKENPADTRFSFDMLGEAARTEGDARRYLQSYANAIDSIGRANTDHSVYSANGISVKLSALHPRYQFAQADTVIAVLLPRITELCIKAKTYNIGLSIDAEESERLDISLDIFEALARHPDLENWQGLGFVLQAYQKRAALVANWLIQLADETGRRLMVRLVKGAYWDAEIKHAQELGLNDYPVFTRKANTDLSYGYCAKKLLQATQQIFPQFATHNAYTAAMVIELAGERSYEFQRLHGMGQLLYRHLQQQYPQKKIPLRVYAPIGKHKDLLPYLVRRLLENGANSSFVNRFLDKKMPVNQLIQDINEQVIHASPYRHKGIPVPENIFKVNNEHRKNARGIDLDSTLPVQGLLKKIAAIKYTKTMAGPIVNGQSLRGPLHSIINPANKQHILGWVSEPSAKAINTALNEAAKAQPTWNARSGTRRAPILNAMADLLEDNTQSLISLIVLEAGRTLADALSEVREAVDFCRYYANQGEQHFVENGQLQGCGTFLCISPWNFPLAIFVGQIAAALMAGNTVIAKPAEQTPLVASEAVKLFHSAGVPVDVLHLLPGDGARIGEQLVHDARLSGITFTGSTATAQYINRQLATRPGLPIPLIAETGGQNCMLVDSTALPEQVVDDVISSAFLSAGQRCSALRVLFLQEDIADTVINMLTGAMMSLVIGDPSTLSTDIGPVIDDAARQTLQSHIDRMHKEGRFITATAHSNVFEQGHFIAPQVFEIESLEQLPREVFGPVLHIIRYSTDQLDGVLQQINNTGYGLTLGIHSRIEAFANYVFRKTQVGNTYINRNMVGAVVGVNPFGGHGLSGTGPKAGGPHYLYRFSRPTDSMSTYQTIGLTIDALAATLAATKPAAQQTPDVYFDQAKSAQQHWNAVDNRQRAAVLNTLSQQRGEDDELAPYFELFSQWIIDHLTTPLTLPGPTGEQNTLSLHGRGIIAVLLQEDNTPTSIGIQTGLALAAGCAVLLLTPDKIQKRTQRLITTLSNAGVTGQLVQTIPIAYCASVLDDQRVHGVMSQSSTLDFSPIKQRLAARPGPVTPLICIDTGISPQRQTAWYSQFTQLLTEKTRTENLVARGGNAQLLNLQE